MTPPPNAGWAEPKAISAPQATYVPRQEVELVFAGNLLIDDLVFPDGRTRMGQLGGAMVYASLGATLWGTRAGVVSVAGSDYPSGMLAALEARGVDLGGLQRLEGPGLRTWLLYEPRGRRVVHQLGLPGHADVSPTPAQMESAFPAARGYHLSPMPLGRQRELVAVLARRPGAFVSLDPYEAFREDNLMEWLAIVKDLDALFIAEDELELDGVARDPRAALGRLGVGRIRWIAFKRGTHGGLLWDREADRFVEWAPCRPPVVDHTGAGDAFAGGFLAGILAGAGVEAALQRGVISASYAIESWGATGLLAATPEAAERRREQWFASRAAS